MIASAYKQQLLEPNYSLRHVISYKTCMKQGINIHFLQTSNIYLTANVVALNFYRTTFHLFLARALSYHFCCLLILLKTHTHTHTHNFR